MILLIRHAQVLRGVLILESADEILGWKLRRWQAAVAQQVSHSVVVLAMSEPTDTHGGTLAFLFAVPHRRGEFLSLHRGKTIDPRAQSGLFGAAGHNPLPAGMGHTVGRLLEQERRGGSLRVHQLDQGLAESLGALRCSAHVREISRVAEATPSEVWQLRQAASSNAGYTVFEKGVVSAAVATAADAPRMQKNKVFFKVFPPTTSYQLISVGAMAREADNPSLYPPVTGDGDTVFIGLDFNKPEGRTQTSPYFFAGAAAVLRGVWMGSPIAFAHWLAIAALRSTPSPLR